MTGETELAAARAAGIVGPLRFEDGGVRELGAADWRVTPLALPGLERAIPGAYAVAPLATDVPGGTWVVELKPGHWLRLDEEAGFAELLAALPDLPSETIARIAAAMRGPAGGERPLFTDEEVDSLLAELAAQIAPSDREFVDRAAPGGGRHLAFLAASLRPRPPQGLFHLSVARWEITVTPGSAPVITRRELLTDVLLERYRGRDPA